MIDVEQYINFVLDPVLHSLKMHSRDAVHLMLRTALIESRLSYLNQLRQGPALGFFQTEPATIDDVYRYLETRPDIKERLLSCVNMSELPKSLLHHAQNLALNCAIARVKYWMVPEPIPSLDDIEAQGEYWKKYYNTELGKGSVGHFVRMARFHQP